MPLQDLLNQAVEVRPGDHLVALYAEEKEIEDYVTSFIHSALLRNERCLYITGDVDSSAVLRRVDSLSAGSGASGELLVLDKSDVYSKGGKFSSYCQIWCMGHQAALLSDWSDTRIPSLKITPVMTSPRSS